MEKVYLIFAGHADQFEDWKRTFPNKAGRYVTGPELLHGWDQNRAVFVLWGTYYERKDELEAECAARSRGIKVIYPWQMQYLR